MGVERLNQTAQHERFEKWASNGTDELPVTLDTILLPYQQARIAWLRNNVTGTILEVFCSWGYNLAYVKGHCGVDINPDLIALAKRMHHHQGREFHTGDARALPVGPKSYDTVMLTDGIEHLEWRDVPAAIEEAKGVARRRILLTVPDGELDTEEARNAKHRFLLTRDRLSAVLRMLDCAVQVAHQSPFVYVRADLEE